MPSLPGKDHTGRTKQRVIKTLFSTRAFVRRAKLTREGPPRLSCCCCQIGRNLLDRPSTWSSGGKSQMSSNCSGALQANHHQQAVHYLTFICRFCYIQIDDSLAVVQTPVRCCRIGFRLFPEVYTLNPKPGHPVDVAESTLLLGP